MNKKQIERENLKYVLYSIFDNYGDLSKKIYIVVNKSENNNQICEEILKKINQNTPSFIRKILSGYNDYSDNATVKLKKINQNLEIVSKYELDNKEDIVIDIFSSDLYKEKNKYSYESKFESSAVVGRR